MLRRQIDSAVCFAAVCWVFADARDQIEAVRVPVDFQRRCWVIHPRRTAAIVWSAVALATLSAFIPRCCGRDCRDRATQSLIRSGGERVQTLTNAGRRSRDFSMQSRLNAQKEFSRVRLLGTLLPLRAHFLNNRRRIRETIE